ncbi:hypothetical protein [Caulobacter endophyticus]|uniref:hypothetical protein n=1 Tax=Caulobacter endophyticus TaxID=2172652 RepID=UPI00240EFAB9|nr:hypothetical protein [Caulobacter endophyticus]MDG2531908.1 hypothetical protein [Caulobacter endophyticus]
MKRTYMIAAAMVAFLTVGSAQASTTQTAKPKASAPVAPPRAPVAPAAPAQTLSNEEKAGCGAVLMILGQVSTSYPQLFAKQGQDARGIQFVLEAFGAKGRMMMDEAFEDGAQRGLKPSKVYEEGLSFLFENAQPVAGETAEQGGRRAAMALMQRCTGIQMD